MALKNWHPGKLVMLWVADFLVTWWVQDQYELRHEPLLIVLAINLALGILTWKWLSSREKA